jgi:hypothetical protein
MSEFNQILSAPHGLISVIDAMFDLDEHELARDPHLHLEGEKLLMGCTREKWMCDYCFWAFVDQRLLAWLRTTGVGEFLGLGLIDGLMYLDDGGLIDCGYFREAPGGETTLHVRCWVDLHFSLC